MVWVGVGVLGGDTVGGADDGEREGVTVGGAVDWDGEGDEGGGGSRGRVRGGFPWRLGSGDRRTTWAGRTRIWAGVVGGQPPGAQVC